MKQAIQAEIGLLEQASERLSVHHLAVAQGGSPDQIALRHSLAQANSHVREAMQELQTAVSCLDAMDAPKSDDDPTRREG